MSLLYSVRRKGHAYAEPVPLREVLKDVRARLQLAGGPYRLRRPGVQEYGPQKMLFRIMTTLAWNLPKSAPGQVWRVMARADSDKDVITAIRVHEAEEQPVYPNGPGTDAIDQIHGATVAFVESKGWRVQELGICVNKPGEHGHCNAWDGGAGGDTSEEIHRRILAVGEFLKAEGIKHRDTGGKEGLPVLGVIVMYQFWRRSDGDRIWHDYDGVGHVSHWHVSGYPGFVPGWI